MDGIRPYLIEVCIEARDSHHLGQSTVAGALNINQSKVARFEQGKGGFHRETEKIVSGYAKVSGVEPIEIWRTAMDRWAAAQAEASGAGLVAPVIEPAANSPQSESTNPAKGGQRGGGKHGG